MYIFACGLLYLNLSTSTLFGISLHLGISLSIFSRELIEVVHVVLDTSSDSIPLDWPLGCSV